MSADRKSHHGETDGGEHRGIKGILSLLHFRQLLHHGLQLNDLQRTLRPVMDPANDPITSIHRVHVGLKIPALVLQLPVSFLALVRPYLSQGLHVRKFCLHPADEKTQLMRHRAKNKQHALLVRGRKAERSQHRPAIDRAGVNAAAGIATDNGAAGVLAFAEEAAGSAVFQVAGDDVQHVLPVLFDLVADGEFKEASGHAAPGSVSAEERAYAVTAVGGIVSLGGNLAELARDAGPIEEEFLKA